MKKILSLVLIMLMVVSFSACKKSEDSAITEKDTEETVSNKTDANSDSEISDDKEDEDKEEAVGADEEAADDNGKDTAPEKNESVSSGSEAVEKPEATDKNDDVNDSQDSAQTPDNSNKTLGNKLLAEFKSAAGTGDALSVAKKLAGYSELEVLPMDAVEVEPGLLTGFNNTEITGFKEGAMFLPMMGTIPFVGYVFTLEDGTDVSAFISELEASANLRWNICTTAEEMVTGSSGNKVFFVMCNQSLEN